MSYSEGLAKSEEDKNINESENASLEEGGNVDNGAKDGVRQMGKLRKKRASDSEKESNTEERKNTNCIFEP